MTVYDIYRVVPNYHGTLDKTLIAGRYVEWDDVITAVRILHKLVFEKVSTHHPVFEVQVCHHRSSSHQFKIYISHTAPITEEELTTLL